MALTQIRIASKTSMGTWRTAPLNLKFTEVVPYVPTDAFPTVLIAPLPIIVMNDYC